VTATEAAAAAAAIRSSSQPQKLLLLLPLSLTAGACAAAADCLGPIQTPGLQAGSMRAGSFAHAGQVGSGAGHTGNTYSKGSWQLANLGASSTW
jgi:hypothetical protein